MPKALPYIPHSRPTLDEEEARAAAAAVASGHVAEGPAVAAFEQELAAHIGVRMPWQPARDSGSAPGVGGNGGRPGDEVIIPSFVCSALLPMRSTTPAQFRSWLTSTPQR
jgi:perosamine synthetase